MRVARLLLYAVITLMISAPLLRLLFFSPQIRYACCFDFATATRVVAATARYAICHFFIAAITPPMFFTLYAAAIDVHHIRHICYVTALLLLMLLPPHAAITLPRIRDIDAADASAAAAGCRH